MLGLLAGPLIPVRKKDFNLLMYFKLDSVQEFLTTLSHCISVRNSGAREQNSDKPYMHDLPYMVLKTYNRPHHSSLSLLNQVQVET